MRTYAAVDASRLSRFANGDHPLWWGVLGAVTIEFTVVGGLIGSYFYLRMRAPQWPPAGVDAPDLLLPTINIFLLLASAWTMWWAGRGANRNSRLVLTLGTGASVALATCVIALRTIQLHELNFRWDDHAYGSIFWAISGFHYIHVASAIVGTAAVTLLAGIGYFNKERQLGVVVDTLYWYFVAGIWIPLYLVLYWAPRLQ